MFIVHLWLSWHSLFACINEKSCSLFECLWNSWVSKRILLFGCERQLCQHLGSCMEGLKWIWRKVMSLRWIWTITTTHTVLMARRSLFCQLLPGLAGRMTSLALLISLLEDWASFWLWPSLLYILSSLGNQIPFYFLPCMSLLTLFCSWHSIMHFLILFLSFLNMYLPRNGVQCPHFLHTLAYLT